MEVVILLAIIGLGLVGGALALFTRSLKDRDWQHAERLSLFPIQDDVPRAPAEERAPEGADRKQ